MLVLREMFLCEAGDSDGAGRCCLVVENGAELLAATPAAAAIGHCPVQRGKKPTASLGLGLWAQHGQGLPLAGVSGRVGMWQFTHQTPHCLRAVGPFHVGWNDSGVPDHAS